MEDETKAATSETPVTADETPVAASETPVTADETPVAASETPVAADETPVAADETPVAASETPIEYTSESAEALVGTGTSAVAPGAGLGRRKEAVARVRLVPGSGEWTLNGRTLEGYFPNKVHQQLVNSPFSLLKLEGKFDVHARIHGGGPSGQAGALRLGVARALNAIDLEANRAELKKAGFLTRDPRVVERKKAGLKKARRAPQYSKR